MKCRKIAAYISMIAGVALAAGVGVQAADQGAAAQTKGPVVSSYEYSAVSYGTSDDGKTYSRVVTKRNGVTQSDVTTVGDNGGVLTVNTDASRQQIQGYMNGIELKDGDMKAKTVTAQQVNADEAVLGNVSGKRIDVPTGVIGGIVFNGSGSVSGVQTNGADPGSAVSVAYLQEKLAALEGENKKLQEELKALQDQMKK